MGLAWGYDLKPEVRNFRLPKMCSFRLPLTKVPAVLPVAMREQVRGWEETPPFNGATLRGA